MAKLKIKEADIKIQTLEEAEKTLDVEYKMDQIVTIPISQIYQRSNIREEYENASHSDLEELSESIKTYGLQQPITVAPDGKGKFVILIGHRRFRACLLADIQEINCIIRNDFVDEKERIIYQAIENEQRKDFSSREREKYISDLRNFGMQQSEIAKVLKKSKGWVSEAIKAHELYEKNKDILGDQLVVCIQIKDKLYYQMIGLTIIPNSIKSSSAPLDYVKRKLKRLQNSLPKAEKEEYTFTDEELEPHEYNGVADIF